MLKPSVNCDNLNPETNPMTQPQQTPDLATLAQLKYPGIDAGVEGVRWVENCVRSADAGATWVDYA